MRWVAPVCGALTLATILFVGSMVFVYGCTIPDEIHLGLGHRDELFWGDPYEGQTISIEGVWRLNPTRIEFTPEAELFLAEHSGSHQPGGSDVTVNLPEGAADESLVDDLGALGKDSQGNWTPWGVVALLAMLMVGREVLLRRKGGEE